MSSGNCRITFNSKRLQEAGNIYKYSFREARRQAGNIYAALIAELMEENCTTTAKYFQKFKCQEENYFNTNVVRDRLKDESKFLLSIFDHCKMAEKSAILQLANGWAITFRSLYQVVLIMAQPDFIIKFDWIRKDAYEIIAKISDRFCEKYEKDTAGSQAMENVNETICKIYLRFAIYLAENGSSDISLKYFEKSLALCRLYKWISDIVDPFTKQFWYLHDAVARYYCGTLVKFSKQIATTDFDNALKLVQKGLCVLAEAGIAQNKVYYIEGLLSISELLIESSRYEQAFKHLETGKEFLNSYKGKQSEIFHLRLKLYMGQCYMNLNNHHSAMENFKEVLKLAQIQQLKAIEAQTHMLIGKLRQQQGAAEQMQAQESFKKAKIIFKSLKDVENTRKAQFLLAQVMSELMFPHYLDLIKSTDRYCSLYTLQKWKYELKPFWTQGHLREESMEKDNIICLLKE